MPFQQEGQSKEKHYKNVLNTLQAKADNDTGKAIFSNSSSNA